jgi:hypothetical protein
LPISIALKLHHFLARCSSSEFRLCIVDQPARGGKLHGWNHQTTVVKAIRTMVTRSLPRELETSVLATKYVNPTVIENRQGCSGTKAEAHSAARQYRIEYLWFSLPSSHTLTNIRYGTTTYCHLRESVGLIVSHWEPHPYIQLRLITSAFEIVSAHKTRGFLFTLLTTISSGWIPYPVEND